MWVFIKNDEIILTEKRYKQAEEIKSKLKGSGVNVIKLKKKDYQLN